MTFSSLIEKTELDAWQGFCDLSEIRIAKGALSRWKSYVASYMRSNYLPRHLNEALHASDQRHGTGLSPMIDALIPKDPKIMKGDFGEALCSLTLTEVFGNAVPYLRWANKNSVNFSEPGIDMIGFRFDPLRGDEMTIAEAKSRDKERLLNLAIIDPNNGVVRKFLDLTVQKICLEINLILKKIENDSTKSEVYGKILDFLNAFGDSSRRLKDLAFFVHDSSFDPSPSLTNLKKLSGTGRPLRVVCIGLDRFSDTVEDVFNGMT